MSFRSYTPLEMFEPFWRKIQPYMKSVEVIASSRGYGYWFVHVYFVSEEVREVFRAEFTEYGAMGYHDEVTKMGIAIEYYGDRTDMRRRLGI